MRKKLFTHGTTFFMTAEMYDKVKIVTDSLEVSISDFIRGLIENHLRRNPLESDMEVNDVVLAEVGNNKFRNRKSFEETK